MEPEYPLAFGPFRVDGPQGGLWQGAQAIVLRPQALALLRYLVAHPGRLVTKAEVRRHVWADTHVTDTALRVVVAHVGMPGKQSPTSNTTLYRFWEPVIQPLYEN